MSIDPEIRGRYLQLCEDRNRYDELYRQGSSEISDQMYDSLEADLVAMEAAYPELRPLSEPSEVPAAWSLERTFKNNDVRAFDAMTRDRLRSKEPLEYVVEPKIDGWSLSVVYQGGHLVAVHTRGGGGKSRNLTARIKKCRAVREQLIADRQQTPRYLELRGEAIVSLTAYASINRERRQHRLDMLRTPRDCVGHLLTSKDHLSGSETDLPLEIHYHEVFAADIALPDTYHALMTRIEEWGLTPIPFRSTCVGVEQVFARFEELLAMRDKLDYEMDGVVLKLNRMSQQHQLGEKVVKQGGREKRLPLWALAYKFPYRGELGTVMRLIPTGEMQKSSGFEFEVHLDSVAESVRAVLDPTTGLHWSAIWAGDVVRIQRPLGKTAQIIGLEELASTRLDFRGVTFLLLGDLTALRKELAEEVIRFRGGHVTDHVEPGINFVVMDETKPRTAAETAHEAADQIVSEEKLLYMLGLEKPLQLSLF